MRPVLLEMHGFAAFREPATVDFAGAEYFALVGPTGSGKSTVIDAMTFALYGSVPRWDDRRTVALALSPTANRGTVRLLFDVGPTRYVVARELRRAASGAVTVRNARLERLVDPDDPAADTEVLAHDGAVSRAVEELLGLPFEQFCICVVLPQGDFAQFLHAKPADRQRTLTRILGLGMYETMAREAGAEARLQAQRAELLGEQLAGYADATEEALAEAAERERALSALVAWVAEVLPGLAEADADVQAARRATEQLAAEAEALSGLSAPAGLVELADRARQTSSALAAARDRLAAAERSDTEARERLAAAPDRERPRQLRRDHAELARLDGRLPELDDTWRRERGRTEAAGDAATEAEAALEQARAARDEAVAVRERLRAEASRLADEWAALTSLRVPNGVVELDAHRAATAEELAGARGELAAAETADAEARDALSAAPDRAWLEQARRDHVELLTAERAWLSVSARHDTAAALAAEASTGLADAERALAVARIERDVVARSDLVAALRPSLAPHRPCPVCEQPVTILPPPADAADLSEANAAVQWAGERRDQAAAAQRAAAEADHRAAAEVEALADRIDSLRARLSDAPALLEEVDARLAMLDRLAAAARAADERLRHARRAAGEAEAADAEAARQLASAGTELRAARDPLVALGAPALDPDDPVGSWRALTEWATEAAAERAGWLTDTERAAADAERVHADAERALAAATEDAERRRAAHTEAVRAEQDAGGELARARRRRDELAEALADAPSDDELARWLDGLDRLDAEVQAADAALRSARAALREAREAAAEVSGRVERGWRALRSARDPLVGLGAPMLDAPAESDDPDDPDDPDEDSDDPDGPGDHLVAAWHTLVGWARRARTDRDRRLHAARDELADARRRLDDTHRMLVAELAEHGVTLADDRSPVTAAAPAASAALERARAATARLAERRDAAAALAADRTEAERAGQVARMLAGLLRSDAFPRWLVASALDALVADASRNLAELSGGQFELAHSDGEFLVVDHADADARRPVKTLSGGETFQASLALALALSEQLATLAAAGAARLDSIFLDEGFGTLDEANLEVVAGTLENLATLGDRMVGVITHVPALAERVPVRFTVGRDQRTSSITRETN
jgi:DNA repair protein SbcC/Rad50